MTAVQSGRPDRQRDGITFSPGDCYFLVLSLSGHLTAIRTARHHDKKPRDGDDCAGRTAAEVRARHDIGFRTSVSAPG
jgi:hypothetical protein